jgi:diacylglycerol kinase (ATP)
MAGTGLDAMMVRDAEPRLKDRLGWVAYVGPAVRALRAGAVRTRFRTDTGVIGQRRLHAVVIGNFGRLQGGVALLPDADPEDGCLDAALIGRGGVGDWLRTLRNAVTGGDRRGAVESLRFRALELHSARPRPVEVDGEVVGECADLSVRVEPGALLVKVPRWDR